MVESTHTGPIPAQATSDTPSMQALSAKDTLLKEIRHREDELIALVAAARRREDEFMTQVTAARRREDEFMALLAAARLREDELISQV